MATSKAEQRFGRRSQTPGRIVARFLAAWENAAAQGNTWGPDIGSSMLINRLRQNGWHIGVVALTPAELADVLDALDAAAEDLAYRADYESKLSSGDEDDQEAYQKAADRYSSLRDKLSERAAHHPKGVHA